MNVFWRLILAHLLTDFTFQTNGIAEWKRRSFWGVLVHSSIFLVLSVIFTWPLLLQTWWKLPGYICVILLFAIHIVEDYYRIFSIRKVGSPDNIFFFLWDQFIHVILIFLFSPLDTGKIFGEKLFIIFSLAVMVTHFTSIFIYYIEDAFFGNELITKRLKGKYYLIVERLLIFACFLLPGFWWIIFPAVWIVRPFTYRNNTEFKFSHLNVILSNLSAIGFGILARLILFS